MLDQSAYNYYLSEVLGVGSYIGSPMTEQPQVEAFVAPQQEVLQPTAPLDSTPVVVVDAHLNTVERNLLNKIMQAVSKLEFKLIEIGSFQPETLTHSHYLIFNSQAYSEQNCYEVFNKAGVRILKSVSLKEFLPPTQQSVVLKNKILLWSSIKNLFKVAK